MNIDNHEQHQQQQQRQQQLQKEYLQQQIPSEPSHKNVTETLNQIVNDNNNNDEDEVLFNIDHIMKNYYNNIMKIDDQNTVNDDIMLQYAKEKQSLLSRLSHFYYESIYSPYTWYRVIQFYKIRKHKQYTTIFISSLLLWMIPIIILPLMTSSSSSTLSNTTTTPQQRHTTTIIGNRSTSGRSSSSYYASIATSSLLSLFRYLWSSSLSSSSLSSVLALYLYSPYSIGIYYRIWHYILYDIYNDIYTLYYINKSNATNDAKQYLSYRIQHRKLAYRTKQYDIYIPSSMSCIPLSSLYTSSSSMNNNTTISTTTTTTTGNIKQCNGYIIFIPGAFVDHISYNIFASILADCSNYIVLILSLEPLRIVDDCGVCHVKTLRNIMNDIEYKFNKYCINNNHNNWYISGHSMGGLYTTKLMKHLHITKCIMYGVAPFIHIMNNISNNTDINIQIIQGTNDDIINTFSTTELYYIFYSYLPFNTNTYYIKGGTHNDFANYINYNWNINNTNTLSNSINNSNNSKKSSSSSTNIKNSSSLHNDNNHNNMNMMIHDEISIQQQQYEAIKITLQFLLNSSTTTSSTTSTTTSTSLS